MYQKYVIPLSILWPMSNSLAKEYISQSPLYVVMGPLLNIEMGAEVVLPISTSEFKKCGAFFIFYFPIIH